MKYPGIHLLICTLVVLSSVVATAESPNDPTVPDSVATHKDIDLRSGIDVKLPTKGVVILTTKDSDSTITAGKQSADICNIDATVEVDASKVLAEDFLGAGVQWSAYPWFDVSESDWQKVFRRLDYMKLPFTRVMVDMTTFFGGLDENGRPRYLFDCELMQRVYKLLDYCETNNITVLFGHWGWPNRFRESSAMSGGQNFDL